MVEIGIGESLDLIPQRFRLLILNELRLAPRIHHNLCPSLHLILLIFRCLRNDKLQLRRIQFKVVQIRQKQRHKQHDLISLAIGEGFDGLDDGVWDVAAAELTVIQ